MGTTRPILLIVLIITVMFFIAITGTGCKDTGGSVSSAAKLQDCYTYTNASDWENAIIACNKLETDEGRHLAAQAYMSNAGLDMLSLLSGSSSDPSELLSGSLPDTEEKTDDLRAALNKLMGEIEDKDNLIYVESIFVSGLLIYNELNQMVDAFIEPTADIAGPTIIFYGLDPVDSTADFYQDLCGSITDNTDVTDSSHDGTTVVSSVGPTIAFTFDVTIDSCLVSQTSPLYYNKLANDGYVALGNEAITALDFYNQMDTGVNFEISLGTGDLANMSFCVSGQIEPPDPSDDALNDCEVLGALTNFGFTL